MGKTTRTIGLRIPLLVFRLFTRLLVLCYRYGQAILKRRWASFNTPWVIADEPGAWATNDGALMFDAISTSLGKPNSPLKALFIGTLAPAQGGWWHDLIDRGSHHSTYVQAIQGDRETWDSWQTIRKANPLTAISPEFRKQLLEERDAARGDPRLKARFLSYRLNVPDRRRV